MDLSTVITLTILLTAIALLQARTVVRRRAVTALLWIVVAVLLVRWAAYRDAWIELGLAVALTLGILGSWWAIWGRRLPRADDSNIRVWSEDDPF